MIVKMKSRKTDRQIGERWTLPRVPSRNKTSKYPEPLSDSKNPKVPARDGKQQNIFVSDEDQLNPQQGFVKLFLSSFLIAAQVNLNHEFRAAKPLFKVKTNIFVSTQE